MAKATVKDNDAVDPNWKGKYVNLRAFYDDNYPSKYYTFDKYEYSIDPMETMDQIEAYSEEQQRKEIIKCAQSFNYFCHKYLKIAHPKKGLLPFITFGYQRRVVGEYSKYRFCIISKFRQGGLTTVTTLWALWRCLFQLDETIMVVSKTDREAIAAGEIVKRAIEELPNWMQPDMSKNNDHQKLFADTGCKLFFYPPEAARGRSITYLIIDEAAFIQNMEQFWNGILPTVSTGGNVIVISTVNGVAGHGGWYYKMYMEGLKGENEFHVINLDYWEHPDYNNEQWVAWMRAQLGENGWKQEVLRDFLGGGNNFVTPEILKELATYTKDFKAKRQLFKEWVNSSLRSGMREQDEGALHVWKEPVDGRDYIMGVDAAAGIGDDGDNSAFEIIDATTCEQVAEFYSNNIPNHVFAQVVAQTASIYNTALVVVENESYGNTVLSHLQNDVGYENLYFQFQGKSERVGMKTTKSTRPTLLDTLRSRLLTRSIAIRSRRFLNELEHFIFNKNTSKPEAAQGHHDDLIMSMALALYGRESHLRNLPIGAEVPQELTERYKTEVYEDIKAELAKGAPEDWFSREFNSSNILEIDLDHPNGPVGKPKRKHHQILQEFGW